MKALFQTDDGPSWRPETVGWFGGFGALRSPWAPSGKGLESFGSLGLLAGFLTRFAVASLAVIMLGAITMVHLPQGFFMNGSGSNRAKAMSIIYWSSGLRLRS
jgi:putative oxidoreductase